LAKDADNIKWKGLGPKNILGLKGALSTLSGQGISLEMDAEAFSVYAKEDRYGTRDVGTDAGC
jgi:hypothetical protein